MLGSGSQAALLKDKRIRIITISEIRYEGTLYQINTKDKTIALKNVVSFGTEDRKTDQVIPPSQNVYELIIFKASHIKDINVLTPEEENKAQVANKVETEETSKEIPPENSKKERQSSPHEPAPERKERVVDDEEEYQRRASSSQGKNGYRQNDRYGGHYKKHQGHRDGYRRGGDKGPKNFDFEEMVEKNNLLEKAKEEKEDKEGGKYHFDDFFDTMSTSVNDKGEGGKKDAYHQYKTNTETFGFQKRHHRGGGHRGRGGSYRGGYQGDRQGYREKEGEDYYRGDRGGYRKDYDRDNYYPKDRDQGYSRGGRGGGFRGRGYRNDYDDGDKFYEKKN